MSVDEEKLKRTIASKVAAKLRLKKYRKTEKGRATLKRGVRKYRLKQLYNLTPADYHQIFQEQKGCCAICGRHQSEFKCALAVDHNHETGEIRGLLCNSCNTRLGTLEDEIFIKKVAVYLKGGN